MDKTERGKFAEEIALKMFEEAGRKIYRNGIEHTNPDFFVDFQEKKDRGIIIPYDPLIRQLLSKPDFIVENVDGTYSYLEIKYRSIGHLPDDIAGESLVFYIRLKKYFKICRKSWKPHILLVTDEPLDSGRFTVLSDPYLEEFGSTVIMHFRPLSEFHLWAIPRHIVDKYEKEICMALTPSNNP